MKRSPLKRYTPLRTYRTLVRKAWERKPKPDKKKPKDTGPDAATVALVLERDGNNCRWCGFGVAGERGRDWSIQHRRPRRMGGDPRPDTNSPANLVLVHGSGTTGCHGHIETHRAEAQHHGWLLPSHDTPTLVPLLIDGGSRWVYLTDDGRVSDDPPEVPGA